MMELSTEEGVFMKDKESQRYKEGTIAGIAGLCCNLVMAGAKFFIGALSNSVTIAADGANNLMDSISSLLTILGFRMEAVEEDEIHPYGHGRIEYVTGFLISVIIIYTGISVGKEAVMSILYPKIVLMSMMTVAVLIFSILMKLSMALYYRMKNKRMRSPILTAMGKDSFNDACISAMVLTGFFIMPYSNLPVDGILGLAMAVYIFASGVLSLRDNLALLLGEGPSRKTKEELREILYECAEIESVKEITVHDYGPEKKVATAEVNFSEDCDGETIRRSAERMVELCRENMNIELSIYSPICK